MMDKFLHAIPKVLNYCNLLLLDMEGLFFILRITVASYYFTEIHQMFKCIIICNFRKESRRATKFRCVSCDIYEYLYIIECYYST